MSIPNMDEVKSIETAGSVISGGEKFENEHHVKNITIYLKTAVRERPVDTDNDTLTISYLDPYTHILQAAQVR